MATVSSIPLLAVIIPSGDQRRDDSLQGLLADIREQSIKATQVEVVRGVHPNGKARNQGAERTQSQYVIFLDDDVRLGHPKVFENLIAGLQDPSIGLVGTAQLLPPDSSEFQKRCALQISRSQSEVVSTITDSDMVTTQCCATRRHDFERLGGFNDRIPRGVDPEFRHRVRNDGLRVCVVPDSWHYHPMPKTWKALWTMAWRNGASSAFVQRHHPEAVLFNPEGHTARFEARRSFTTRVFGRVAGLAGAILGRQWARLVYDLAYALGYFSIQLKPSASSPRG